jgi:hypothetical protein
MRRVCRRVLVWVVLALAAGSAAAAPKAELWSRWQAHDPASTLSVDHAAWGAFLDAFLRRRDDGLTLVAYGRVDASAKARLAGYLAALESVPVSRLARPQQMAYWVNLYNALTVRTVLERYPVRSIRDIDISPGLFADGPWGAKLVGVEGERLSLDDVEHRILRPIWRDPRIHYAVNCASIGCPNLAPEPWRAERLDEDLDAAAIAFINHPRAVRIEGGKLIVSSIYRWFAEDFGGTDRAVIKHLAACAAPDLAMRLQKLDRIDGHAYDWTLNDTG